MSRPNSSGLSVVPKQNRFSITSPKADLGRILAIIPGVLVLKLDCSAGPTMLTLYNQKPFVSNRSRQSMEEQRPKKLLDQVRACPELAEGTPSASSTTPSAPSKPTPAGSNATSFPTTPTSAMRHPQGAPCRLEQALPGAGHRAGVNCTLEGTNGRTYG